MAAGFPLPDVGDTAYRPGLEPKAEVVEKVFTDNRSPSQVVWVFVQGKHLALAWGKELFPSPAEAYAFWFGSLLDKLGRARKTLDRLQRQFQQATERNDGVLEKIMMLEQCRGRNS